MTTESTQPQPELGPATDNGPVQSQGHRRRRRRRKNKSNQPGAVPNHHQPQQAQPQMQAAPPAHAKPAHQNQGRKKKKFFQKGSGAQP